MTNEELANELGRLAEKATPGPFRVNQIRGYTMDYIVTDHPDFQQPPHGNYVAETGFAAGHTKQRFSDDAALIAAALNGLPATISALRQNARMREALRKAEQLASIATDWNLDEVEIDGKMVRTHTLLAEFRCVRAPATLGHT